MEPWHRQPCFTPDSTRRTREVNLQQAAPEVERTSPDTARCAFQSQNKMFSNVPFMEMRTKQKMFERITKTGEVLLFLVSKICKVPASRHSSREGASTPRSGVKAYSKKRGGGLLLSRNEKCIMAEGG